MDTAGLDALVLAHDVFFGDLQFTRPLDGITLSHRIASCPPEEVRRHSHLEAHLVLVTGGRYVSSARSSANPRATLIYNPPGTTHRDHFVAGRGSFFTVSISNTCLAEWSERPLQPVAVHLAAERAVGLASALLMECARWNGSSSLRAESLCLEILSACSCRSEPVTAREPRWLRIASEMIQDAPSDTPTVRDVASAVGVHPTHLARAFRRFVGCTPGDLLRTRRVQRAAALLMSRRLSIAEIALEAGFSDQAQFSKAFRRLYGIAPGQYRRATAR